MTLSACSPIEAYTWIIRPCFGGSRLTLRNGTSASVRICAWRLDETYLRVKGQWVYLYRAVDAGGQTIDCLLSPKRDAAAARRFFRRALKQPHTVNPRTITVDKNAAYPIATKAMKDGGELWRFAKLRQVKYLTDVFDKRFLANRAIFLWHG
jgi:transposase-like protein